MSLISSFKRGFANGVEKSLDEVDKEVIRISARCRGCEWRHEVPNNSWVDRANLRDRCVEHIVEAYHTTDFDIVLHPPPMEEIKVDIRVGD